MKIKFAKDVVKDIKTRGELKIPKGFITSEDFEKWMINKLKIKKKIPRN